jgi:hypothetical protein
MRKLRDSSLAEYASWYLLREARKGGPDITAPRQRDHANEMRLNHAGKMRNWFDATATWSIVELENASELASFVFLESHWTQREGLVNDDGPNYRILDRVAANAIANGYLHRPSAQRHRNYCEQFAAGSLELTGENRIAVCSAEPEEIAANPSASLYLLDGVGRCLPFMILLKQQKLGFAPIEAFLAKRGST